MNILVEDSFIKDIKKLKDKPLLEKIKTLIGEAQKASSISELNKIKKLEGYKDFYRSRIGDYRAGFKLEGDTIRFMRFLHRKNIYKYFPPN